MKGLNFLRRDPTDLEAEALREKTKEEWETIRRCREADDFKWIMSDKRGRNFLWGILERSGLFSLPYDGTGEGAIRAIEVTSEARLVMGLIFAHGPAAFTQMILEQENDYGPSNE
jgi:hypothetical protein